ncbi:Hypothetical protein BCPG_04095 [Burkholderia cenocepacia PC184]|nr:Hypothetical protein BCPG_04095 [Burkholderia cenocepacia PC184]
MVAALIAYRAIYFGVPLVLSAGLLAGFEGRALRRRLVTRQAVRVSQLAPVFLSLVTFAVGGMLVISSATPAFWHRISIVGHIVAPARPSRPAPCTCAARRPSCCPRR